MNLSLPSCSVTFFFLNAMAGENMRGFEEGFLFLFAFFFARKKEKGREKKCCLGEKKKKRTGYK